MIRRYFTVIILLLQGTILAAQDDSVSLSRDFVEIANETYFNTRAIIQANELYVQAADYDPRNVEANYMAGRTYLETIFKTKALKYLKQVLDTDPAYKFNLLYLLGQSSQFALDFDNAIDYYNRYKQVLDSQPGYRGEDYSSLEEVDQRIFECINGKEYVSRPRNYVIENAGPLINSEWDDFAPVLNADETMIVFSTKRQDGNLNENVDIDLLYFEDIFISTKQGGQWIPSQNIGEVINTPYHDSNLALSADGKELYIYRDVNAGDIFYSEYRPDGSWSKPVPLESPVNSSYKENAFSIAPNGNVAFFSSNRPTSLGGLDIFYATKDRKGKWTVAKSIGPVINTPYDEDGPFIDYDGKTLYFSSKGHKGMGGYDIYKTVYDSATQTWSEPINIGYPMNTPDEDVYFVSTVDGKRGYYSSAREDGLGYTDIYHVNLVDLDKEPPIAAIDNQNIEKDPEPEIKTPVVVPEKTLQPVTLLLKVVDSKSQKPINASVQLEGAEGMTILAQRVGEGIYEAQFSNESSSRYTLTARSDGYMYKNLSVNIPAMEEDASTMKKLLQLDPLETGYRKVLRNIYFDYGKASLKSESHKELDNLTQMIKSNPNMQVEISGHTDNYGGTDFNKRLSERRARAVVDYLVKNGVQGNNISAVGYGETQPLASNDDEQEGRELNRRVEFKITGSN